MKRIPLKIEHADDITTRLDAIGMHLSEFSFANLFLFRKTHQYEVCITDSGTFFLSGVTYDKKRCIMPMTSPKKAESDCYSELKAMLRTGEWDFLFPISEEWLDCFEESEYERNYNLNDSDYLFFTEKLKKYPGKAMHKKKNLLNQFLKNYDSMLLPFSDDLIQEAQKIVEIWQQSSPQEMSTSDYHQCIEALSLWKELGLTGAIAFADQKPVGFLLGEPLNDDTFTIHFAKADITFKGVYQFLFSQFAVDMCPDYQYMNLEQDMGNEGLRKTKVSYRPDLMAHKYRVKLR